jgi:hypothetical protein
MQENNAEEKKDLTFCGKRKSGGMDRKFEKRLDFQ